MKTHRILIVTEAYADALQWARAHGYGFEGEGWKHVRSISGVTGLPAGRYILLDNDETSFSIKKVLAHFKRRGFTEIKA